MIKCLDVKFQENLNEQCFHVSLICWFISAYGGQAAAPYSGQYNAPAARVFSAAPSYPTQGHSPFGKPAFQPQNYQPQQLVGAY